MRKSLIVLVLFALLAAPAAYVAVPFWTAWSIREAIKVGDSAYLARKIDFAGVRETLRPSLAQVAFDMPDPALGAAAPNPSLWKRIKAYWGQGAIDRFVESYVTPEGLPRMFQWRKTYRDVTSTAPANAAPPSFRERFATFWARLKRAEFKSMTAFEIELQDQYDDARSHVGLLELVDAPSWGMEWKLTELRVRMASATPAIERNVSLSTDR